ncbi:MAG: serine hydrolase [Ketobacteraceae bacterium]|nr:serine hydrolase [Ketobacteraceae bacterium]
MSFRPALSRQGLMYCILAFPLCLFLSGCTSPPGTLLVFDNLHLIAGSVNTVEANHPIDIPDAAEQYSLPMTYEFQSEIRETPKFLTDSGTAGMVIVHKGKVIYEDYNYGKNRDSLFLLWSVTKSVTSALVGIAIEEGYINAVTDPVTDYVPSLANTAYANSTIEDVLEMASGIKFNETYLPGTDIFWLQLAIGGNLDKHIQGFKVSDHPSGTFNEYKSSDTQVLGMVLAQATGQSLAAYLQTRVWDPAGMTGNAKWLADRYGREAAWCCLRATVRDMAKFGLIYLNNGFYNNSQIVPEQWVAASVDTSKPHLQPGDNPQSDDSWGYGYQWWVPDTGNDYSAVGVYNQFIYVNPDADLVIAKTSGPPDYAENWREDEHIAFFRAISKQFLD